MTSDAPTAAGGRKIVATNRRARHEYFVLETVEAGIELHGTEVKSVRAGEVSLAESFASVENGQVLLRDLHIQPYRYGNVHNHEPKRPRRLLLHHREIARLYGQCAVKGQALIPLDIHLRRGLVKVELGVCKGKHTEDKREALRRREADREAQRAISDRRRQ
jgi:SsrA-binding protein